MKSAEEIITPTTAIVLAFTPKGPYYQKMKMWYFPFFTYRQYVTAEMKHFTTTNENVIDLAMSDSCHNQLQICVN